MVVGPSSVIPDEVWPRRIRQGNCVVKGCTLASEVLRTRLEMGCVSVLVAGQSDIRNVWEMVVCRVEGERLSE